ncbi:MAG: type II toxin-antitoxin system VapB family antitoxin [Candidatus Omnitrophica bacterium]|nr:type II toxin-antitoxin system VapB family antitoxin [Candidatus Omnitrophota bacterium]MCK5287923.1 type II toxin-antitoxin system VapB family antitoxin [Candidatus Omnitrophota bacterium]
MATNLALDDKLIMQALKVGHHKTKREAVTAALKEYIAHKKQLTIKKLFGAIDFDPNYDYKKARKQ